jgi:hypothetical protein
MASLTNLNPASLPHYYPRRRCHLRLRLSLEHSQPLPSPSRYLASAEETHWRVTVYVP